MHTGRKWLLILFEATRAYRSFAKLVIVPKGLRNIIFIAFHANPAGEHFGVYQTVARIQLRFTWPGMFKYCKDMIKKCAGCRLANATVSRNKLYSNFPIEAPMMVLHIDIFTIGAHLSLAWVKPFLIACCGMTTFACGEPVSETNSTIFAQAVMSVMLRYGMAHTIVIDKNSKFYATFEAACELLELNVHTLSSGNHDPMLVERVGRFLNKELKIMCQERDSVRVGCEAVLMLLYGWNSCPIPLTDTLRSLVVCGREFTFPIDFSAKTAVRLTSSKKWIESFAAEQARLLKSSRAVAKLLIEELCACHQVRINDLRPDPKEYVIGDRVFSRRKVQSDKKKGRVSKTGYHYTEPCRVLEKLDGSSY